MLLRERYGTVVAGGQGQLVGQILRSGRLGWVEEAEIGSALQALDAAARL